MVGTVDDNYLSWGLSKDTSNTTPNQHFATYYHANPLHYDFVPRPLSPPAQLQSDSDAEQDETEHNNNNNNK